MPLKRTHGVLAFAWVGSRCPRATHDTSVRNACNLYSRRSCALAYSAAPTQCSHCPRVPRIPHLPHMQAPPTGDSSASDAQHFRGGRARVFPDLPWGAPPSWGQSGKPTKWLIYWEFLTSALCLYVGIKVPYESGFDSVKSTTHQLFSDCALNQIVASGYEQAFAVVDLLIDFCFFIDLVINFLTARWIIDREGREHWRIVEDLYTIRQMYMFRCPENDYAVLPPFWLDILGIIPWQYADCLGSSVTFLKNFRVFRLIKYVSYHGCMHCMHE